MKFWTETEYQVSLELVMHIKIYSSDAENTLHQIEALRIQTL